MIRRVRSRPIGYYVHHHGVGHLARYRKIASASCDRIVAISELAIPGGVHLPCDVVTDGSDPLADGALHWAPVGDERSARRSQVFGKWLAEARPRGVVVDVSVEAALLCRLFGVATVVVRQHGDRTDTAHEVAYRTASHLLAPFPRQLEHVSTPDWIIAKTIYTGFIGAGCGLREVPRGRPAEGTPGPDDIVILWGTGGGALTPNDISGVVRAAGGVQVWFAGEEPFDVSALGVRSLGWVGVVPTILRHSPTVIGSAGNNVVADAACTGCALVVVPQPRPFDEQIRHAESLDAAAAASVVSVSDDASDWQRAIRVARQRRGALNRMATPGGAAVAASAMHRFFS